VDFLLRWGADCQTWPRLISILSKENVDYLERYADAVGTMHMIS
jgi:hypothetical protein